MDYKLAYLLRATSTRIVRSRSGGVMFGQLAMRDSVWTAYNVSARDSSHKEMRATYPVTVNNQRSECV